METLETNSLQLLEGIPTTAPTVDIKEKGQGRIVVYGSNLSSGIYTYTLLIDGKVHETKKMMKVK